MKEVLDDLGIDAIRVDELRTYANSKRTTIVLALLGASIPKGNSLQILLDTDDAEILSQVKLGEELSLKNTDTVDIQANAFTDFFTKSLPKFFGAKITPDELTAVEKAVIAFVGKDGLALAVDAVNVVEAKFAGTGSTEPTGPAKLAEAVVQFKADAAVAKKDLSTMGSAALNFVIEGALQIAMTEAVKAAATIAIHAEAEPAA